MSPLMLAKPACRAARKASRLWAAVGAAQSGQALVKGSLHPQAQPVHARLQKAGENFFVHGLRVCLQRYLRTRGGAGRGNEPGGLFRSQQAGSAAAEIHRVRMPGQQALPAELVHPAHQCIHIFLRNAPAATLGIKIAVTAFCQAVGDMKIKTKGHENAPFAGGGFVRHIGFWGILSQSHYKRF